MYEYHKRNFIEKTNADRHKIYICTIIGDDNLMGFFICNNPIPVYYHLFVRSAITDPHTIRSAQYYALHRHFYHFLAHTNTCPIIIRSYILPT